MDKQPQTPAPLTKASLSEIQNNFIQPYTGHSLGPHLSCLHGLKSLRALNKPSRYPDGGKVPQHCAFCKDSQEWQHTLQSFWTTAGEVAKDAGKPADDVTAAWTGDQNADRPQYACVTELQKEPGFRSSRRTKQQEGLRESPLPARATRRRAWPKIPC